MLSLVSINCDKILQKLISIPTPVLAPGSNIISPLQLCVGFLLHVLKLKNSLYFELRFSIERIFIIFISVVQVL